MPETIVVSKTRGVRGWTTDSVTKLEDVEVKEDSAVKPKKGKQ